MKVNRQKGIVRTIILIVVALLVISYLGINLRQLVTSPTTENNFSYVWNGVVYVWDNYLETPTTDAYHFFVTYVWDPAIADIERIDAGQNPSGEHTTPGEYPAPPATQ